MTLSTTALADMLRIFLKICSALVILMLLLLPTAPFALAQPVADPPERIEGEVTTLLEGYNPCIPFPGYFSLGKCIAYFFASIFNWVLWVLGLIVGLLGSIFTMFANFSLSGAIYDSPAIDIGWRVLRDVANIAFIFLLLYIGIATMLDLGVSSNKLLARIVIAVLLMNFSLALAKIPIDASNIFATAFYNAIEGPPSRLSLPIDSSLRETDIAGGLMAALNPQRLFSTSKAPGGETETSPSFLQTMLAIAINFIFSIIALGLLIYVFLTGIVIFLLRTCMLFVVLIFSPFAVIAYAAGMDGIFKKWRTYLVNYSIVAPVYIFFIYLTCRLAESPFAQQAFQRQFTGLGGLGVNAITTWASQNALFITIYLILLFFLQSGAKFAKDLGIAGAGAIDDLGKKFSAVGKIAALATPMGAGMAAVSLAQTAVNNPATRAAKTRTIDKGLRGIYDRSKDRATAELEGTAPRSGLIRRTGRNLTMRATSAALGQTEDRIKEFEKEFQNMRSADELKLAISSPFISAEKALAGMRVLAEKFKDFKPFGTFDPQKFETLYARYKNLGVNTKGIEDVDPRFAGYGKATDAEKSEEIRKSVSKRANKERINGYDKGIFKNDLEGKAITQGNIDSAKIENLIAQQQHSAEGEQRLVDAMQEMLNELHASGKATGKSNIENITIALENRGVGHLGRAIAQNSNAAELRALIENKISAVSNKQTSPPQNPPAGGGRSAWVPPKAPNTPWTP